MKTVMTRFQKYWKTKMYEDQIAKLQEKFNELDMRISLVETDTSFSKEALKTMQSQRSMIYYDIQRLIRLKDSNE